MMRPVGTTEKRQTIITHGLDWTSVHALLAVFCGYDFKLAKRKLDRLRGRKQEAVQ